MNTTKNRSITHDSGALEYCQLETLTQNDLKVGLRTLMAYSGLCMGSVFPS